MSDFKELSIPYYGSTAVKTKKLHASYWSYEGNHYGGHDCDRYDPHGFGVALIGYMDHIIDNAYFVNDVSLEGAKCSRSKSDGFGRVVKVAATAEQWEAAKMELGKINA